MDQFSPSQIEAIKLLYESAKTFIPVVTGYLVLFSGSIGYLWKDERHALTQPLTKNAGATIILGIASLGVWSGVIPFCIRTFKYGEFNLFAFGQYCAQIGHILFFISVISGVLFYWRVFISQNKN
jgi:hypothetical protein